MPPAYNDVCAVRYRHNTMVSVLRRSNWSLHAYHSLSTPTTSVGVGRMFESVGFLFVCLRHNSKTNDPKVFKLDIGNDLGISCKWHGFGLKGQRSTLGLRLTAILRGFELYECPLVEWMCENDVAVVYAFCCICRRTEATQGVLLRRLRLRVRSVRMRCIRFVGR